MPNVKQVFMERVINHRFSLTRGRVDEFEVDVRKIIWGDQQSQYHQQWLFGDEDWSLPKLTETRFDALEVTLTPAEHNVTTAHPGSGSVTREDVKEIIALIKTFQNCFDSTGDIWPKGQRSNTYNLYDVYTMVKFKLDWMDRHTLSFANRSNETGDDQLGEDDVSTQSIHDGY